MQCYGLLSLRPELGVFFSLFVGVFCVFPPGVLEACPEGSRSRGMADSTLHSRSSQLQLIFMIHSCSDGTCDSFTNTIYKAICKNKYDWNLGTAIDTEVLSTTL